MSKQIKKVNEPKHYYEYPTYVTREEFLEENHFISVNTHELDSDLKHLIDLLKEEVENILSPSSTFSISVENLTYCIEVEDGYYADFILTAWIPYKELKEATLEHHWEIQEKTNKQHERKYKKDYTKWKEWEEKHKDKYEAQEKKRVTENLEKAKARYEKELAKAQLALEKLKNK